MAAPQFLLQTGAEAPALAGGQPVQARFAEVQRAAGAFAGLFAEPVPTRDASGSIVSFAWYGPTANGAEPEALTSLPQPRRAAAEAQLREALAALAPRAKGAGPDAALLAAALTLPDAGGILVLDGRPVLAGWGLGAAGMAALGPWLPGTAPAPAPPRAAPTGGATAPPAPPPPPPGGIAPGGPRRWWLLPVGLGIAALFLALGFWLGWRALADQVANRRLTAEFVDRDRVRQAIELQRRSNETLAEEVERARAASQGNVCRAEPNTLAPPGRTLMPQDLPARPTPAPAPDAPLAPRPSNLLQQLDQAVVLVIGQGGPDGTSIGTGFFVGPGQIVTNNHVVAAAGGQVVVTSRHLGRAFPARVVQTTAAAQPGQPDFALLQVEGAPSLTPFTLTRQAQRLDEVVAAGFPAAIVQNDARFRAVVQGDLSQLPDLVTTDGRISAIQTLQSGLVAMPHTASISPGNSGGPLVDRCGRVVGVNTFNFINAQMAERVSYAQKTEALLEFLRGAGVTPALADGACSPQAAPVPVEIVTPAVPPGVVPPAVVPPAVVPPAGGAPGTAPPAAAPVATTPPATTPPTPAAPARTP
ncbi:S1C family serine protease [Humitalea sp. 24SJ18S-53]|uniref:S1C family serine protease n=1 Tax=Humitalea sp. 24SJ18S-53 TaxID=3422307 RepID=UPI003D66B9E7